MFAMVHSDGAECDQWSPGMGGGGIQTTSESCFQHKPVRLLKFKMHQGRADEPFERGQIVGFCQRVEAFQQLAQMRQRDLLLIDANALTPTDQMRRCGNSRAKTCGSESAVDHASDRSFSIGSNHLNSGDGSAGVVQIDQDFAHPIEG